MRALLLFAALAVTGCATTPPELPHAGEPPEQWSLTGRLALSNGRDGGSGQLQWWHGISADELRFHGAFGRGSWRLSVEPLMAVLATGDGKSHRARDVSTLIERHTGWVIPVKALAHWVVGEPDPGARAKTARDEAGRLELLIQRGWTIQYSGYYEVDGRWLPRKITADKDGNRVRLLVRNWHSGPGAAANPPAGG